MTEEELTMYEREARNHRFSSLHHICLALITEVRRLNKAAPEVIVTPVRVAVPNEQMCECGHGISVHTIFAPMDYNGCEDCDCEEFNLKDGT